MKKITYTCNLCLDQYKSGDLFCLYWDSTIKTGDTFGAYKLENFVDKSDKHICVNCVKIIKNS